MNPRIRLSVAMFLLAVFAFVMAPAGTQANSPYQPDCPEAFIQGDDQDNIPILGNAGNSNTIEGFAGDDWLDGEECNDLLIGGDGEDTLQGWLGNDVLRGGAHDDYLNGYHGDDVLMGGAGDDEIDGDEGDDVIFGNQGIDDIDGGPGFDICYVERNLSLIHI